MAKVDYSRLAADIISEVGGAGNVATASHCATRLRLKLKDQSKASKTGVEALDGVLSVVEAGGQFQVVIGNDVPLVYEQINKIPGVPGGGSVPDDEDQGEKGNIFNQFIAMISSIFLPFLWTLAGIGLLKAFISLAVNFNWLEAGNGADVPPRAPPMRSSTPHPMRCSTSCRSSSPSPPPGASGRTSSRRSPSPVRSCTRTSLAWREPRA